MNNVKSPADGPETTVDQVNKRCRTSGWIEKTEIVAECDVYQASRGMADEDLRALVSRSDEIESILERSTALEDEMNACLNS